MLICVVHHLAPFSHTKVMLLSNSNIVLTRIPTKNYAKKNILNSNTDDFCMDDNFLPFRAGAIGH